MCGSTRGYKAQLVIYLSITAVKVKVGDGEETLRRDASMYMYKVLEIRNALSIPLPLSTIILVRFLLVNTNIDNKI